ASRRPYAPGGGGKGLDSAAVALSPISDDWSDEILQAVIGEFNGELQVVKPGKPGRLKFGEEGGRERGTDEAIIIDWRPARAQHVRLALEQAGSAEWATKRRYRFQSEMLPSDPIITKGMLVRFRGGND